LKIIIVCFVNVKIDQKLQYLFVGTMFCVKMVLTVLWWFICGWNQV